MAFYPLEVLEVRAETRDAVAVTLAPPAEAEEAFSFRHGQYLTFRRDFDGEELRRSYSICAAPGEALRVGIKRVQGGAFSSWAHGELQPGDMIEAMPPAGRFTHDLVPDAGRHYLGFAIGSGITPVLSIVKTVLRGEPLSRFTLVYGNRSATSIMFREELEDLKNRYLGRLNLIHILKNDAQEVDLFTGRIDAEKCERLFAGLVDVKGADLAFICGPEGMMKTVSAALQAHGMAEDRIRYELFGAAQPGRARVAAVDAATIEAGASARITMDGATREITLAPGQTVLEAALGGGLDAPFSCTAGVCCTCRAKLLEGEVEMAVNHALEDDEVRAGYVLTCQARPLTERLVIDYDQH